MSEREYMNAIDEIKASDQLKKDTLQKIEDTKDSYKKYKVVSSKRNMKYVFSSVTCLLILLFTFSYMYINSNYKSNININSGEGIDISNQDLEQIQTFENLQNIAKKLNTNTKLNDTKEMTQDTASKNELSARIEQSDFSETNIQVEGVKEGDIVKTDGKYLYYISNNRKLVIVDVTNQNKLNKIKEIEYQGEFFITELYIYENKLLVIGNEYVQDKSTYNSRGIYLGSNSYTKALVYDVSNKQDIKIIREVKTQGYYLSSRMIEGNVYFVSRKDISTYALLQEDAKEQDFMPAYKDTAVSSDEKSIAYDKIYCLPEVSDTNYTLITSFHINDNIEANIETFLGSGGTIYCSNNNLYIVGVTYNYSYNIREVIDLAFNDVAYGTTIIYKFRLNNTKTTYIAKAEIEGRILNQFSMDEHNGYFRIATTKGNTIDQNTNNIYVFDEDLNQIGSLEGLAKGEQIYSVRFMEDRCYMVTYKQVDPLFVIDLKDPKNPNVLGELKIPGYSTYLHPYDENHIIGFGNDTKTQTDKYGTREVITGMKMALFDVSNVNSPKELFSTKIGGEGTYSELLYNHKALLFSKEKNMIAFPITISNNNDVTLRYNVNFQGAIIYSMNLENGFVETGKISHSDKNDKANYYSIKTIDRILYIGNQFITTSPSLIKLTDMNTLEELDKLEIQVEESYYIME